MGKFHSITGIVIDIGPALTVTGGMDCRSVAFSIRANDGTVASCRIDGDTYLADYCTIVKGECVVCYYDLDLPSESDCIFQFHAAVVTRYVCGRMCAVDYFDDSLCTNDGIIKLEITPYTRVTYKNGQLYPCSLKDKDLFVMYNRYNRYSPNIIYPYLVVVL